MTDGNGKDLIGDGETQQPLPDAAEFSIHLLGEGNRHQGIAGVDDQLGYGHFHISPHGGEYGHTGELAGRREICQGNQDGFQGAAFVFNGHQTESDRYGKNTPVLRGSRL